MCRYQNTLEMMKRINTLSHRCLQWLGYINSYYTNNPPRSFSHETNAFSLPVRSVTSLANSSSPLSTTYLSPCCGRNTRIKSSPSPPPLHPKTVPHTSPPPPPQYKSSLSPISLTNSLKSSSPSSANLRNEAAFSISHALSPPACSSTRG